jgi:hypothetical protein
MKTNIKYLLLSSATVIAVTVMSIGTLSFAQTVSPLSCSLGASSVGVNQSMTITATGGDGTYAWFGPNLNVTNSAGSRFTVSYPNPGTYPVNVSSAGQTATCNVNVIAAASTAGNLVCSPAIQNVTLGQTASVSATGGNGSYTWSSPDLTIANHNGSGFSANYASTGLKTLTVMSGGFVTSCSINVLASGNVTPSLPNTGGGYSQ